MSGDEVLTVLSEGTAYLHGLGFGVAEKRAVTSSWNRFAGFAGCVAVLADYLFVSVFYVQN